MRRGEAERVTLNDQIVRQQNKDQSHTSGFEVGAVGRECRSKMVGIGICRV